MSEINDPGETFGFKEGDRIERYGEEFVLDEIRWNPLLGFNVFFFWSKHNRWFASEDQLEHAMKHPKFKRLPPAPLMRVPKSKPKK